MQVLYPSLVSRLETQHQTIENIISSINASRLIIKPQPNKWNIHENIAHLVRYQKIFIDRINLILNKEDPFIERYIAEDDVEFESFKHKNLVDLKLELMQDRKSIYDFIKKLSTTELNRIGAHKKFGPLNIVQWTEFFLLHEAHHLYTIFQLAYNQELTK